MEITGQEIKYLHVCPRKLWLFRRGIRPEMENNQVRIGMLIGERSFARETKEIPLGEWGVLDWADFADGIIHETKKAPTQIQSDRAQVSYYLWLLNHHGVAVHEAQIHYPKQRKTAVVAWNETCAASVEKDLQAVEAIHEMNMPPPAVRKNICKSCAYEEVCFA